MRSQSEQSSLVSFDQDQYTKYYYKLTKSPESISKISPESLPEIFNLAKSHAKQGRVWLLEKIIDHPAFEIKMDNDIQQTLFLLAIHSSSSSTFKKFYSLALDQNHKLLDLKKVFKESPIYSTDDLPKDQSQTQTYEIDYFGDLNLIAILSFLNKERFLAIILGEDIKENEEKLKRKYYDEKKLLELEKSKSPTQEKKVDLDSRTKQLERESKRIMDLLDERIWKRELITDAIIQDSFAKLIKKFAIIKNKHRPSELHWESRKVSRGLKAILDSNLKPKTSDETDTLSLTQTQPDISLAKNSQDIVAWSLLYYLQNLEKNKDENFSKIVTHYTNRGIDFYSDLEEYRGRKRITRNSILSLFHNKYLKQLKSILENDDIKKDSESYRDSLNSLLLCSSSRGNYELTQLLLTKVTDINIMNSKGLTPLAMACKNGHWEIVKLLLTKVADINIMNSKGLTPLAMACKNGHLEIVKLLLENGANVNSPDNNGNTPLSYAFKNKNFKIIGMLIEKDQTLRDELIILFKKTFFEENLDNCIKLWDNRAEMNISPDLLPLLMTSLSNREHGENIFKHFFENVINHSENPNFINQKDDEEKTFLMQASEISGSLDFINFLIENGANLIEDVDKILEEVINSRNIENIKFFLDFYLDNESTKGKDFSREFWLAGKLQLNEITEYLVKKEVKLDLKGDYLIGFYQEVVDTMLIYHRFKSGQPGSIEKLYKVAELLIEIGANTSINRPDYYPLAGMTAGEFRETEERCPKFKELQEKIARKGNPTSQTSILSARRIEGSESRRSGDIPD